MVNVKKVFTEILPYKIIKNGKHIIQWNDSIDYIVHFIYCDKEDNIKIINHNKGKLTVLYNNENYIFDRGHFVECKIGKIFGVKSGKWRVEIGQIFKDGKRDLTIIDRERRNRYKNNNLKSNDKWYKYHCNKCGNEDWIEESHLLKLNRGCNVCCNISNKVLKGYNDIKTTNPEIIKYFVNKEDVYKYTAGSNMNVLFKCPNCGYKKEMRLFTLIHYGFGCPKCSDGISYPNKFMFNLLEQLGVNFKNEYSPKWIGKRRYDFYFEINNKKYIVEMDGGWHNADNEINGQTKEISKKIDNYKDKLAEEHEIEVIRIDCDYIHNDKFNFIKNNILKSKLNEIFDLSNIDWIKIGQDSEKSLVKKVCDYYNKNNINNTIDINTMTNELNLKYSTIKNYLNQGAKIGLCNYYGKYNHYEILSNKFSKPLKIYKNNKLLGIFKGCADLDKQSENLFGVKLHSNCISRVCNKEGKQYKGFTFKYISKEEYEDYIKTIKNK